MWYESAVGLAEAAFEIEDWKSYDTGMNLYTKHLLTDKQFRDPKVDYSRHPKIEAHWNRLTRLEDRFLELERKRNALQEAESR